MSSLPEEICFAILYKVPAVETLLACKFVCKSWYSLISSPDFVKKHLELTVKRSKPSLMLRGFNDDRCRGKNIAVYTLGHDSIELLPSGNGSFDSAVEIDYPFKYDGYVYFMGLVGCCNGLVCLYFCNGFFCLWNPATREYKGLPEYDLHNVDMIAFGYDNKNNDYKLLVVQSVVESTELPDDADLDADYELQDEPLETSMLKVYSLMSNSWKTVGNVSYRFPAKSKQSGVLFNGDRHWIAERQEGYSDGVIVSLDISNETFKEIELPFYFALHNLGVLDGCLCLFVWGMVTSYVDIWVMQKYGVRQSWTKRHTLTQDIFRMYNTLRLMRSFKSGEILFVSATYGKILLYDPKDGSVIEPNIPNSIRLYEEECYFESLVPLNSRTYVTGQKQKEESEKDSSEEEMALKMAVFVEPSISSLTNE